MADDQLSAIACDTELLLKLSDVLNSELEKAGLVQAAAVGIFLSPGSGGFRAQRHENRHGQVICSERGIEAGEGAS